ncbi:MAG: DUF488 family protein [Calditrichaeota bacterium]|nr:MAG: DUF488 family protein [Calditrichota bacterium]
MAHDHKDWFNNIKCSKGVPHSGHPFLFSYERIMVKVKSIYEKPSSADGERIYIDRLWADGAFTEFVKIADWRQDLAPSYDLWRFGFDPGHWEDYVRRYREELQAADKQEALRELAQKAAAGTVTLVYGNGDAQHNNALVLQSVLEEMSQMKKAA